MIGSILFHPVTTFVAGAVVSIGGIAVILSSCAPSNKSAQLVSDYKSELAKGDKGPAPGTPAEKEAIQRFTTFLQNIGSKEFIRQNTSKTYAADAYLNDTLTTQRGEPAIEKYFLKTSESLTNSKVTIDDIVRSGPDHYVRWTMIMSAPALAKGQPVHSVGISQVRFDSEGKVVLHQDFWDSGDHFFGKLPVAGGVINFIRNRLK